MLQSGQNVKFDSGSFLCCGDVSCQSFLSFHFRVLLHQRNNKILLFLLSLVLFSCRLNRNLNIIRFNESFVSRWRKGEIIRSLSDTICYQDQRPDTKIKVSRGNREGLAPLSSRSKVIQEPASGSDLQTLRGGGGDFRCDSELNISIM